MTSTPDDKDMELEKVFIEKANKVIPNADKGVDIGLSDTPGAGATTTDGELEFPIDSSDGIGETGADALAATGDVRGPDSETPEHDTDLPGLSRGGADGQR